MDEMSEVVDRLEAGESPESIEESMPDLSGKAWAARMRSICRSCYQRDKPSSGW
jgi:hypothetical protein